MRLLSIARAFRYAGRLVAAGEVFEAKSPRDARLLKALRRAVDAPPEPAAPAPAPDPAPAPRPVVRRRAVIDAEPESDTVSMSSPPTRSRRYRRRDLTVEE